MVPPHVKVMGLSLSTDGWYIKLFNENVPAVDIVD